MVGNVQLKEEQTVVLYQSEDTEDNGQNER